MKLLLRIATACLLAGPLCLAPALHAQMGGPTPAEGSHVSPAEVFDKLLTTYEREIVAVAEAMPEDKYSFAPTTGEFKGVRTFSEQLKHIADANFHYFGALSGSTSDTNAIVDAKTSKADIIAALKQSYAFSHKAIATITAENAFVQGKRGTPAGIAAGAIAHGNDHYGQLVVYLRMNGLVPLANLKKPGM